MRITIVSSLSSGEDIPRAIYVCSTTPTSGGSNKDPSEIRCLDGITLGEDLLAMTLRRDSTWRHLDTRDKLLKHFHRERELDARHQTALRSCGATSTTCYYAHLRTSDSYAHARSAIEKSRSGFDHRINLIRVDKHHEPMIDKLRNTSESFKRDQLYFFLFFLLFPPKVSSTRRKDTTTTTTYVLINFFALPL